MHAIQKIEKRYVQQSHLPDRILAVQPIRTNIVLFSYLFVRLVHHLKCRRIRVVLPDCHSFQLFERSVCKLVPGMKTRTRTKPVLAPLEPACIPFLLRICSLHKLAQQQKARFHPSKPSHNMQLSHHAVLFFCSHSLAFVKSFDNPCRSIVSQDVFCFS